MGEKNYTTDAINLKSYDLSDADKIIVKPGLDDAVAELFTTKGAKFAIANYTAIQPTRTAIKKYMDSVEMKGTSNGNA